MSHFSRITQPTHHRPQPYPQHRLGPEPVCRLPGPATSPLPAGCHRRHSEATCQTSEPCEAGIMGWWLMVRNRPESREGSGQFPHIPFQSKSQRTKRCQATLNDNSWSESDPDPTSPPIGPRSSQTPIPTITLTVWQAFLPSRSGADNGAPNQNRVDGTINSKPVICDPVHSHVLEQFRKGSSDVITTYLVQMLSIKKFRRIARSITMVKMAQLTVWIVTPTRLCTADETKWGNTGHCAYTACRLYKRRNISLLLAYDFTDLLFLHAKLISIDQHLSPDYYDFVVVINTPGYNTLIPTRSCSSTVCYCMSVSVSGNLLMSSRSITPSQV